MPARELSFTKALIKLNKLLLLDRADIASVYLFAVLAGIVQLSLPLGIQSIISFVMAGAISTSIVVLIILALFGVFINGLLQIRQLEVIEKVKQKIYVRYSLEFSDRLPKINIEKLDNEYLPELVNTYFDSVSLQKGIDKILIDLPAAIIQVLVGLILLSFYHPIFIAFGLVLIAIVLGIISLTSTEGLVTAINASSYKYKVAAWLQEVARSIKTFKYAKNTAIQMRKTDQLLEGYLDSRTSHFKILIKQFWSLVSFKILITGAMLIIGSFLLVNQQINVGQFIAADIVIIAIIGSVEKIITNLDTVYDALVSIEKLGVITESETEKSGTLELETKNEGIAVDFQNVNFSYGNNKPALKGISFSIPSGEMVQLRGASGSGKTTILRLLTGAFNNYDGTILIDKLPLRNYAINSLRNQTGILLESQDIFQGTLWENLTMGNDNVKLEEINHLIKITGLDEFIQSIPNGYETMLLPVGSKLSNTTKKNILLTRALLGQHRLLLLEEPFSHLQEPYKSNVINYLKKDKTSTIIVASNTNENYFNKTIEIGQNDVIK